MKKSFIIFVLLLFAVVSTYSQDTVTKKQLRNEQKSFLLNGRPWTIEAPIWIPGFAGSFAYGDIEIDGEDGVDPSQPIEPPGGGYIGEILSRLFTKDWYLKFFFLTKISYEKNRFLAQFDALSGAVGYSTKFKSNNNEIIQANFRTTNLRFLAGYKIVEVNSKNKKFRYELFGYTGARVYFQEVYSDLDGVLEKLNFRPLWAEPVFGLQNQFAFKRWMIFLQGDYGGLFDSSKYSLQFTGYVYYKTGRVTSLKFGWNHLQLNHAGVFHGQDYNVKATFSGPSIGIVFQF